MPLKIKISKEITIPTSIVSKRMWEGELEESLRQLKSHLANHEDAILDEVDDISDAIIKAEWHGGPGKEEEEEDDLPWDDEEELDYDDDRD